MTAADGKQRLTDVADTKQLLRLIHPIPSPKAEPFKLWLAKVGFERLGEIENPEPAAKRLLQSKNPRPSQMCCGIIRPVIPDGAALRQQRLKLSTSQPRHLGRPSQRNQPRFVVVRTQVSLHAGTDSPLGDSKPSGDPVWNLKSQHHNIGAMAATLPAATTFNGAALMRARKFLPRGATVMSNSHLQLGCRMIQQMGRWLVRQGGRKTDHSFMWAKTLVCRLAVD